MDVRSVLFLALFVGCLFGVAATGPAAASGEAIELEHGLSQSATADEIDVETRLSLPESIVELELTLPEGADVYEQNGFERVDDRTYEWTGTTAEPSVRYGFEGTVRETHRGREGATFVVADEWALVRTPSVGVSWRSTDPNSELSRQSAVDGEGIASTHMAYLGPYTEHTGAAAGQTFRLVVPEAADLEAEPDAVIERLETAAERLVVGGRSPEVFVVAAPTADHTWGPAGLQIGDGGDMWVRDAEPIGTARDTWVHEYVHTRQVYPATDATRWTIEGMADYYAALLSYESGDISFESFRDRLEVGAGADYDDVRLADPGTWAGTEADYDRGALIVAHLDRRLRAEAGTSFDAVIAGVNDPDRELTQRRFLRAIESAGGEDISGEAERYTETTDAPPIPDRRSHVDAFGGPDIRYSIETTAVSGPYRNGSVDTPELVVGERLELTVRAENVGSEAGAFEAELRIDGEAVAIEDGRLEPDESTTLRFTYDSDTTGTFELTVGSERTAVTVAEPAGIEVSSIEADPSGAAVGEPVTVRATVVSAADRPGEGEVTFAVDGETVATRPVSVGGESATVETVVEFDADGEYAVSAGGQSTTVRVGADGTVPSALDDQSGFGPVVALVALLLSGIARRRSSGHSGNERSASPNEGPPSES